MSTLQIQDLNERKIALDPCKSFIVQAPAGSGKTTLLVERYLTLLSHVNNPEEILAITFTKKAAYEMRTRVIKKLAETPHIQDKIKKWNLIQNPNRLRIQTIDAFCYYLINQTPILTKINSSFQIVQNQDAETYYAQAAKDILENHEDPQYSEHLERILLHINNDWERAKNLFITMLKSRDQWLPHIVGLKNIKELRSKMEFYLQEISDENVERCASLFPKDLHQELIYILKISQNNHEDIHPFLQKALESWEGIAQLLLTKEFSWRKTITKNHGFPSPSPKDHKAKKELLRSTKTRMESLLETLRQHENLRVSLENLLLSPSPNYTDQEWLVVESLLELLPLLAAHLKVIFNESMVTDHAEISMAALRVLGDQESPSDFALNLDYRLQHLLIDEFQDTSLSHYRLIEKLITTWQQNDGRTIFIVGDPMQSIYRFREAEVGLFLRIMQDGIGDFKLQPLTLSTNFRSTQNIIDWVNSNFAKILPTSIDISLGAVPFRPSTATINDHDSFVKIALLKDEDDLTEAIETIEIVKKISKKHPNDTIAILVKARKHLQKIIPALREANLAYQAFELETLNENMVIRDLFSLTRALFDLADRIAWIAILRAPWCGITLEDLHKVANGQYELIWDNICNYPMLNLSEDGKTRLIKLKSALLPILDQIRRMSWRELIEKAWLIIGGPAIVTHKMELEYVSIYLDLIEDPLDITILQKKLDSLYTPPTANAKIQIMTIHKAKGLEFDHVVIPGINRPTRFDERKLMLWFERPKLHQGSGLLLAPLTGSFVTESSPQNNNDIILSESKNLCENIPTRDNSRKLNIYQYLQLVEQKKVFYETGRLLYVAITRAKKSIYIIGNITDSIQTGSLLEQLKPCFDENWIKKDFPKNESIIKKKISLTETWRLSSDWQLPITIDIPESCNKPSFELTDNQATIIGTVIHQYLCRLGGIGVNEKLLQKYLSQQYYRKLLQQSGYLNIEYGLKLINKAIETTLNDKYGRWILKNHIEAENELAITLDVNGKFEHYIIDRTFIDENGIRWIIDYKTSEPKHENIEIFLNQEKEKYINQLLQYKKAIHTLYPTEPIKLGLYFPLFAGWVEI